VERKENKTIRRTICFCPYNLGRLRNKKEKYLIAEVPIWFLKIYDLERKNYSIEKVRY